MSNVYALLVGIDDYPSPLPSLKGCVNDVEDAHRYLSDTVGSNADVRRLLNSDATRDAVVDGFRHHLGRATAGDTALFWFSGHGSTAPLPPQWWHLEPNGAELQTLVCVDSRADGVRDLLDKELALLIREVASRGPHVVVVLDCCHAGGANRTWSAAAVRRAPPARRPPDPSLLTDALRAHIAAGRLPRLTDRGDHVALAACQSNQLAHEVPDRQGRHRGVFSLGLLAELRRSGAVRTYRDLIGAARGHVSNVIDSQNPVLHPAGESIVDQPFLGGLARPPATTMTMREHRGQWIIDVGSCHGLIPSADVHTTRIAVHDSDPVREARVVSVQAGRSVVEPIDWDPVPGQGYPMVLSNVALPETTVTIGGTVDDDDEVARAVIAAVLTAGPGGIPSPHLRLAPRQAHGQLAELVVSTPASESPTISGADGAWLASASSHDRGYRHLVGTLEHIARWRRIRGLRNPISRLSDLVRLEIIPPRADERHTPRERPGLRPGSSGAIELEYAPGESGHTSPTAFIRLDNTSDRPLHCVLLDLTDQFRIHPGLFPGDFVGAHASAAAGEGELMEFSLPPGRAVRPGAQVRDWLMLIVSEDEVISDHFALPGLAEPAADRVRSLGILGVVERLALVAHHRDVARRPATARDWCTSVIEVVTRVPDETGTRT